MRITEVTVLENSSHVIIRIRNRISPLTVFALLAIAGVLLLSEESALECRNMSSTSQCQFTQKRFLGLRVESFPVSTAKVRELPKTDGSIDSYVVLQTLIGDISVPAPAKLSEQHLFAGIINSFLKEVPSTTSRLVLKADTTFWLYFGGSLSVLIVFFLIRTSAAKTTFSFNKETSTLIIYSLGLFHSIQKEYALDDLTKIHSQEDPAQSQEQPLNGVSIALVFKSKAKIPLKLAPFSKDPPSAISEKEAGSYLQAAKQIQAFLNLENDTGL
jgi:hypothetical protein